MVRVSDGYDEDDWDDGPRYSRPSPPPPPPREELYYADAYKIFMIACTLDSFTRGRNHIDVRPFHTLPPDIAEKMRDAAKHWTEEAAKECRIEIRVNQQDFRLELKDGDSGVTSYFPASELDPAVRADILYKSKIRADFTKGATGIETVDPWEKFVKAATPEPAKKPGALSL